MPQKAKPERRSDCPISIALDMLGDRWTLLIVRDLMFKGRHEFGDFLGAEEGIATNMLADRLRKLEEHGIVEKLPHATDARKSRYRLTNKGLDLGPMLVELILWSAKHEKTAAPPRLIKFMGENKEAFLDDVRDAHAKT